MVKIVVIVLSVFLACSAGAQTAEANRTGLMLSEIDKVQREQAEAKARQQLYASIPTKPKETTSTWSTALLVVAGVGALVAFVATSRKK